MYSSGSILIEDEIGTDQCFLNIYTGGFATGASRLPRVCHAQVQLLVRGVLTTWSTPGIEPATLAMAPTLQLTNPTILPLSQKILIVFRLFSLF